MVHDTFSVKQYEETKKPYEYAASFTDPFEQKQIITALCKDCKEAGASVNFKEMFTAYMKTHGQSRMAEDEGRYTDFTGQPLQLASGDWICDDNGVRRYENGKTVIACQHPIMPVSRLFNIDSGYTKIEIAFKRPGKKWTTIVCDAMVLASAHQITALSQQDISVTSSTAKGLVDYLADLEQINYEQLPEKKSTSHMGWVDSQTFVPYAAGIVPDNFDGGNRTYWEAVKCSDAPRGEDRYMEAIREVRAGKQVIPRIVLAASLASVLVQPCGMLPFICHLWGKTGTGKTVALLLASSVWGDPDIGKYTRSCNATQVGLELLASMLNNLPLVLDELQTISNKRDFEETMYMLTEGTNRSRGTKNVGIQVIRKWSNCTITNGEQPITTSSSGGGVVNRILDLECDDKLFDDPVKLSATLKECYGYLGQRFIELLYHDDVLQEAKTIREYAYEMIINGNKNVPEKQAQAASLVVAADQLATEYIFKDDRALAPDDIIPCVAEDDEVDPNKRAYDWLINWIGSQRMHLFDEMTELTEVHTEIYGLINTDNTVSIINSIFKKVCSDAGFNPTSFKHWLKSHDLSVCNLGRYDKVVRVGGVTMRCVIVKTAETVAVSGAQVPW